MNEPSQQQFMESHHALASVLSGIGPALVACSGGIDSLLLATMVHRMFPRDAIIVHAVSPAVPPLATQRVHEQARAEGWRLELVQTGEFGDPSYLANPVDRCYYCKTHLYSALSIIATAPSQRGIGMVSRYPLVSGANVDDLGEYRPGLKAAEEFNVRHPYIEAGWLKRNIREMARQLGLPYAELPASPCLASRLYTGTPVTEQRLAAVDFSEQFLQRILGIDVVRCRVRGNDMYIEVPAADQGKIMPNLPEQLLQELKSATFPINAVHLDPLPYRPGRAFVQPA